MVELARGWALDVDRGPNWLLVKVRGVAEGAPEAPRLADRVWSLLQQHFTSRLVLELDQIDVLDGRFMRELVRLHEHIAANHGVMRLCGLSARNKELLQSGNLDKCFPSYRKPVDAVFACRAPGQPD